MRFTPQELDALAQTKTDRIELYTESYADAFGSDRLPEILAVYQKIATEVDQLGIGINAGHDLNLDNLKHFIQAIPNVAEVSIGHALICDALNFGMRETIGRYLDCLK